MDGWFSHRHPNWDLHNFQFDATNFQTCKIVLILLYSGIRCCILIGMSWCINDNGGHVNALAPETENAIMRHTETGMVINGRAAGSNGFFFSFVPNLWQKLRSRRMYINDPKFEFSSDSRPFHQNVRWDRTKKRQKSFTVRSWVDGGSKRNWFQCSYLENN